MVSCIISLLALKCANLLSALLLLFYFCWSPFNLGLPPAPFGPDDRRASVTAGRLWDGISALMGDEPALCSGSEGRCAWTHSLIHYFTYTVVSVLDEIILVFLSHCLLNSIMANTDPY